VTLSQLDCELHPDVATLSIFVRNWNSKHFERRVPSKSGQCRCPKGAERHEPRVKPVDLSFYISVAAPAAVRVRWGVEIRKPVNRVSLPGKDEPIL
jgi:hypothetical protein